MKVKITGHTPLEGVNWWYKGRIGEVFEVTSYNKNIFQVLETEYLISKSDCYIIEPTWKVMKDAEETGRDVEYWDGEWTQDTRQTAPWYSNCIYRLAPKPPQIEYEPYSYEDRDKLRGLWVRRKDDYIEFMITHIQKGCVGPNDGKITFRELFEKYKTLDGHPVGKLK